MSSGILEKPAVKASGFEDLASRIEGRIFTEGHEKYEESRQIWNALHDRKPAAIVRPANAQDVVETVRFAKRHGLPLSAKSGGHGITGGAVRDGGITIDFSRWKGIEVDPASRIARVQPGLTWGELDCATQEFGLAVPGGKVATVGVGGSALGGGIGWLVRKHGLTIDNLRSVDIVTGDGQLVKASERTNPDLFWGVRGAGAFLGVAVSFELELNPVGPVIAGLVAHPIEKAQEVLAFYREFAAQAPDELTSVAVLTHGPDGGKMVGIAVTFAGDLEQGEKAIAPVRAFGPPIMDMIGVMPYGLFQRELAKMARPGLRRAIKSAFFPEITDALSSKVADAFAHSPATASTILLEHHGGAAHRVSADAMAYSHRSAPFNLVIETGWEDDAEERDATTWLASTWHVLRPLTRRAAYVSFLDADDRERGIEAFGAEHLGRLHELKKRYDPMNILAPLPGLEGSPSAIEQMTTR
jgi:FAD binding domain/Berberine and berberine like